MSCSVVATLAFGAHAVAASPQPLDASALWPAFKARYDRQFANSAEEAARYAVFAENLAFADEENAKQQSYALGVTPFADFTDDEFAQQVPAGVRQFGGAPLLGEHRWGGEALPDEVDWVAQGAASPVKDQGACGSCWAFSTTGALEGAWQIKSGELVSLAEQQFLDCPDFGGMLGCRGGSMDAAFTWAQGVDLCQDGKYAYEAKEGECRDDACDVGIPRGSVTGYRDVHQGFFGHATEEDLLSAVAQQPVSVAIEADKRIFRLYTGGVLAGSCGGGLDHGVLLVGYGTDSGGMAFWRVKNSWGEDWGESGYIRLLRGKGRAGECGILKMPSYPVLASGSEAVV